MRKLCRPAPGPKCLERLQRSASSWTDVSPAQKDEIWEKIEEMQGRLCAYCESELGHKNRHLEHFYPQSKQPDWRFEWSNIFGSCSSSDHCGNYKDAPKSPPYNAALLIKPDEDDAEYYFRCFEDGQLIPCATLTPDERARAESTLTAFNLNHHTLTTRRRYHYKLRDQNFLSQLHAWLSDATTTEEFALIDEAIQEELHELQNSPCAAGARQYYRDLQSELEHKQSSSVDA